jgi:serine/threonine-protein kinase
MGVVYLARQRSLKRPVALKMMLAGLQADSTVRLRFRTEAEAVARLQHPNMVQIHEVGEHNGRPFLSLEYVAGGNLSQKVTNGAQPQREAARLVEMLARAVQYMHEQGIVHRDLKPTNVLLTADGTPKITDFGLAKLLDTDNALTRTETFLGTPSYMAPEQATGANRQVGAAADIYALGVLLYELLTGRVPFHGATPLATLEQVRTQEPVPPRRRQRSIARELETICLKCLAKEPGRRFESAAALADDLHRFLKGHPIQARPTPLGQRLWRSVRQRPAVVAAALGAVVLACLLLTAAFYFQAVNQLAQHQAEVKYHQFVERRNEAFFYGLLAKDEGAMFLGAEPAANLHTAESAIQDALAVAGVDLESQIIAIDPAWPSTRQAEIAADSYALLLVLASITEQQGLPGQEQALRYQRALNILDDARRLGFETRAYHVRRARILEQLGRKDEAKVDWDRATVRVPAEALDCFLAGEDCYRRGDWQRALTFFHRALSHQPDHFWSQFLLALCQLKVQRPEAAKASLNACLTQQPDFAWAYLFRSFANQQQQALPEAKDDLRKALQLHPNTIARYAVLLNRGMLHFNQQQLKQAAEDFRSAIALKPRQYNAYMNLAQVYLAKGQFSEGEAQVKKALQYRAPPHVVAGYHLDVGRALLRNQRYKDAVAACTAALQLAPRQPLPEEVRGRALLALGRYLQAEESFDQYLQHGGAAKTDIFRGRGLARMKLGKYPEAVEDYTRALDLAADADIYQHRGWAHFFCDAWQLAIRDFSRAIELDATLGDAYTGRGLARVMLGNHRLAVADAETALGRKPGTPEMMHNIACIFAQASARAEADPQQPDREALAERYRRRAVKAVRRTLALLRPEERPAFWRDIIVPDKALTPLRNDTEFQQLQEVLVPVR